MWIGTIGRSICDNRFFENVIENPLEYLGNLAENALESTGKKLHLTVGHPENAYENCMISFVLQKIVNYTPFIEYQISLKPIAIPFALFVSCFYPHRRQLLLRR